MRVIFLNDFSLTFFLGAITCNRVKNETSYIIRNFETQKLGKFLSIKITTKFPLHSLNNKLRIFSYSPRLNAMIDQTTLHLSAEKTGKSFNPVLLTITRHFYFFTKFEIPSIRTRNRCW